MNKLILEKLNLLLKILLIVVILIWIASSIYLTISYTDFTQAMPWYMGILIPTLIAIIPMAIIIGLLFQLRNKLRNQ